MHREVVSTDCLHLPRVFWMPLQGTLLPPIAMERDRASSIYNPATTGVGPNKFPPQVIAFALFGTISRRLSDGAASELEFIRATAVKESQSVSSHSSVSQVQQQFPDIPAIFRFGLSTVQFHSVGVFCRQLLNKGAMLGPFTGRKLHLDEVKDTNAKKPLWEIHQNGKVQYCLDGSDPCYRNWMYFIQYARSPGEQNLMAVQQSDKLFFRAMRDIFEDEELLVWYDKHQYNLYMGIPQGFKESEDKKDLSQEENEGTASEDEEIEEVEIEETDDEQDATLTPNSPCSDDIVDVDDIEDRDNNQECASTCSAEEEDEDMTLDDNKKDKPHIFSPLLPRLPLPQVHHHGNSGLYTVYPYQPMQNVQWLTRPTHPTVTSPVISMPLTWPHSNFSPLSPSHINKSSSNLDMFERWADGTRWRCQLCQRIFTSQGSLRAHARIHTGEKPYQCKFCKRVFTQASTLRSHERLHTGEKPYKCLHCGKAFTQSAGLRSHLKTHITR